MSQTENSPEIDLSYYLQILLFRWSRNLHRLIETRWIVLAARVMQMRLCKRTSWLNSSPEKTAITPCTESSEAAGPQSPSQRKSDFINLMRDSISVIIVMNPIVSFMWSLRLHACPQLLLNHSMWCRSWAAVNETLLKTNALCQNYNTTSSLCSYYSVSCHKG